MPRSSSRPALRLLTVLVALPVLAGCAPQPGWDPQTQVANEHSISDGTQILVPALPGWGGGCYWPFVNLYSGNLLLRQVLMSVPALGFDWDLVLYYNSTLAGTSGALGPGWRHSYDLSLAVGVPGPGDITAIWGDGRTDVFSFDGSGWSGPPSLQGRRITAMPGGYDLRDKHGLHYEYDAAGRLVRMLDRSGHATTLTYSGPRLQQVDDLSGRSIQFQYDLSGRLIQIHGLPPQPAQFQYDAQDRLIRVIHPYVGDHVYSYDAIDRLVRAEDASGRPTLYEYWPATFAVKDARAVGAHRRFGYDQPTLTTSVKDSVDLSTTTETRYTFDSQGRCITVDGPLGPASNVYSALHQIRFHTDPAGHVTEYQYDALGNRVREIRPSTAQREWTYDPVFNLPLTFTNENGKVWSCSYDPNGNLLQATDPLGNFEQYSYDGLDRLIQRIDADGQPTGYGYDANSNVDQITDAAGYTLQLTRNARGAVEQVLDQAGETWLIHRGPRDEVVDVQLPGPLAKYLFTYDAAGFLNGVSDPLGALTTYQYDGLHRLMRTVDPYLQVVDQDRDGAGWVRRVTNALGGFVSYTRDLAGRILSVADADGGTRSRVYDCCNLVQSIDALGNVAGYTYDLDDRLIQRQWPGGILEDYQYDPARRLVRAERTVPGEPLIRNLYTWDDANRLVRDQQTHLGRTVDYTPSAAGDVLSVVDNLQPLPMVIGYDARHQPDQVDAGGVPVISVTYEPRRRIQSLQFAGSTLKSNYTYDPVGRLAAVRNEATSFLATYHALHNLRGDPVDVSGLRAVLGSPYQHLLGFDSKRRVTSEQMTPGPPATTYDYNAVDDRAQTNPPFGPIYSYSPAHRLLTGDLMSQLWDLNGNVKQLAQVTRTLQYDYGTDGQLTDINEGPQNWHFTYGPGGTIAKVRLPGGIDRWIATDQASAGPLRYVELPAPGVAPIRERIYAVDRGHGSGASPIAEFLSSHLAGNFRALMTAHHGSVVQVARPTPGGLLLADRYFDHFGDVLWQSGPQPEVGYRAMNSIQGLDSLPVPVPMLGPGTSGGQRTSSLGGLHFTVPNSGTRQSDGSLGSDALDATSGQDEWNALTGGIPWEDWPWNWIRLAVDFMNWYRNQMIEQGFDPPYPPIDLGQMSGPVGPPILDPGPPAARSWEEDFGELPARKHPRMPREPAPPYRPPPLLPWEQFY